MNAPDATHDSDTSPARPLDLAVIGGGASGFFTALQFAEMAPGKRVAVFEKSPHFLQKVRISGGGRCNVSHACFEPRELAKNYPRGSRELLGAFHRWQPSDTVDWFKRFGVDLKVEPDGRMFPVTDSSQTIIDCFLDRARDFGVPLYKKQVLVGLERAAGGGFSLQFAGQSCSVGARAVCIATGSLKGSPLLDELKAMDLEVKPLVPSLFAFDVSDPRIAGLAGVSHPKVAVRREGDHPPQTGPLLITHRGFSGPAILRLSAWEAPELAKLNHRFTFLIDWLPELGREAIATQFAANRRDHGAKCVKNANLQPIPRRLWESLVAACGIEDEKTWGQVQKAALLQLIEALKASRFEATGKTTNKDEFVTCGGIERSAIDFRSMECRSVPGLYFVGEALDLDGITGGFNFQAAWTTAHLAATAAAASSMLIHG